MIEAIKNQMNKKQCSAKSGNQEKQLAIKFKFNDAMSEEECDEVFFRIFDIIFGSIEPENTPQIINKIKN